VRLNAKGKLAARLLELEGDNNRLRTQQFALMFGWPPFRWLMLSMMAVAVWHTAGVYLDSCGRFPLPWWGPDGLGLMTHEIGSWGFAKLPGDYSEQSFKIIAMLTGVQLTQTGLGALMSYLNRR